MTTLILLSLLGVAALFAGFYKSKNLLSAIALTGLTAAFVCNLFDWNTSVSYFNNMMLFDNYAVVFTGAILFFAFLIFALFTEYNEAIDFPSAEIFSLLFFSLAGAVILVSYSNLLMLFLGIEILSIPLYILAGSKKTDKSSNEAAMKYFLMGAFATGFLLFGIVLIYGASGSFYLDEINNYVTSNHTMLPLFFYAGILLIMIGLGFKVSAVPFHFWTPDVYQGAPTLITSFMATIVKLAGIAAFFRLFSYSFTLLADFWVPTLSVISILTMTVGNLTAIYQTSFKRMLAFSGIAHAGYLLIAIVSINETSGSAILFYGIAYAVSTLSAFTALVIIQQLTGKDGIESFNGLAKNNFLLAFIISVAMCSLAGIPPTAGFFAKFYIFSAAVKEHHLWLTVAAIINSCIGIYYYFRIITAMYTRQSDTGSIPISSGYKIILISAVIITLLLGLFPDTIIDLI